jgi:hypothetical protein
MLSAKTDASELSVAFGVLGLDPSHEYPHPEIDQWFEGSLPIQKLDGFKREYEWKIFFCCRIQTL